MTDALKPCPFCGSDDVEALDMEGKHYVVCYDCALEGPFHKSRAAVIAAWNTRAAPAVPPGWQLVPVEPTEALLWAGMNDEMRWHTLEYDDMPGDACLHCHGDGMDPDRDYLLQCPDCGGSW